MTRLPPCGLPSSCGALCEQSGCDGVDLYKSFDLSRSVYFPKNGMIPTVNWLKVVVPTQCEKCKIYHDYVLYVSRDGRACSAIAKGLAYEQWF